ncbi:hypothetical protein ANN_13013 [Periplaneta americana]|uniref:Uncharacterized protein n=1 Tax=Periplaneta americana TaxID=6978 RepID=A0ABQ8TJ78_PERAM|nr:hypothetical protein ANN_13013 [Periplaneta americana]
MSPKSSAENYLAILLQLVDGKPREKPELEPTVTGMIYLDMLQNWLMPQLHEDSNDYISQEAGFPVTITTTCESILIKICHRDGSEAQDEKMTLMKLPPRSPDLTPSFEYIIRKAKVLAKGKGILCSPNPKPGKPLLAAVAGKVKEFCCSDEISRMMPGNLPRPGIEPGPPGFAARRADRYSTDVDNAVYVTEKSYTEEEKMLALRFAKSTAEPGAQVSYSPAV